MPTKMPDKRRPRPEWQGPALTLLRVLAILIILGAVWWGSGAFFDWVSQRHEADSEHEDRL